MTLKAWSSRARDADLATLLKTREKLCADRAWCFVEGPTMSDFVDLSDVANLEELIQSAWHVRAFCEATELLARRSDFDGVQPWLVRVTGRTQPSSQGQDWKPHHLGAGKEQAMVLYGVADGGGAFVEGQQFRDAFRYPHVRSDNQGARASLIVEVHACCEGPPIVRWKSLRPLTEKLPPSAATAGRRP
ncbi:MAG: hypothetical protein H6716_27225 [Polyangiaceae bacterium]|nr:hypothetical protein [Polyangiaceae bacterium]